MIKTYFVDTNYFLRFILNDIPEKKEKAAQIFQKARTGEIRIIVIPEIIFEIEYILRKQKKVPKADIITHLFSIVNASCFEVRNRDQMARAISLYEKINVDLVDLFLWCVAREEFCEVLSFDEDFETIKRLIP